MTLADIDLPISDSDAKGLALVFTPQLAQRLAELHAEYGSPNCVPMPRVLTDGRLMLCADILTEVGEGGLLHAMWQAADQSVLLPAVEVIPWDEAVAMLPRMDSNFGDSSAGALTKAQEAKVRAYYAEDQSLFESIKQPGKVKKV
jgi:hypothetical protein